MSDSISRGKVGLRVDVPNFILPQSTNNHIHGNFGRYELPITNTTAFSVAFIHQPFG